MKNSILLAALLFPCYTAHAETIKLACNYRQVTPESRETKQTGRIILQIAVDGQATSISGTSSDLDLFITNQRLPGISSVLDTSDAGKWDMVNSVDRKGVITQQQIMLDRNTGDMVYILNTTNGPVTTISGNCDKIDQTRRKF